MRRYSKLWAALLGLSALVAMRHYQFALPGFDAVVMDLIISALTAFGVYQVRNDG